jgi:hypothetical protein
LVNTSLAKTFDLIYDYIDGYSYRGSTVGEITAKIRIIPLDTAGTGLSKYIAAYLKLARDHSYGNNHSVTYDKNF